MHRRLRLLFAAIVLLAGAEAAARFAFDFPLYGADTQVGYWLRPNQAGTVLFTNDWAFNGDSLGVAEEFRPSARFDLLLVGDSIVYGGNSLDQSEKLGPLIEAQTGWQVWPAAAGSWSLQNQLAFLRRNPRLVAGADAIVFVLNSADFAEPSDWRSPYTHPRERPRVYLSYLFERYVLKPAAPNRSPFPVAQRDVQRDWLSFARSVNKPLYAVAYSTSAEADQKCRWISRAFLAAGKWSCFDGLARLKPSGFRDAIHPTEAGYRVLARSIVSMLVRDEKL